MHKSPSPKRRGKKGALNSEHNQFIGASKGGKNTKLHAVVDALGNPVSFLLSAGNVNDNQMAIPLLETANIKGSHILADRAYGSAEIRTYIHGRGAEYVIPPKSNTKNPWKTDWYLYKERHLVECFFNKLKQFRRIATRYDKLAVSFLAFVYIASIALLLK